MAQVMCKLCACIKTNYADVDVNCDSCVKDLQTKLDSAEAAIAHLREASQRVVDEESLDDTTIRKKLMDDLSHALSATSGFKEKV